MKTVAVLMSTYNGEKYIKEQIESILQQQNVDVTLFIRDDGSSDGTAKIIKQYKHKIVLKEDKNVGVGNSFMQLLYCVPDTFDFYAFADQDDIWLDNKLDRAIEILNKNRAELYCSNQTLVDRTGRVVGQRYENTIDTSFRQIMCQNKAAGCTMVWSNKLQKMLSDPARRPSMQLLRSRIHDVWVIMVAACIGTVYYDNNSYIYYRQHENNVVGVRKTNIVKQWREKLQNPDLRNGRSSLCKEIIEKYDNAVHQDIKDELCVYAYYDTSLKNKIALLRDNRIRKITGESKLMYTAKVLGNLF